MRNLEKGLLLCELINFESTSLDDVKKFVAWIREQDVYYSLLENIKELKTSTSFSARLLYKEFASINLNKVKSIEEGIIAYSKILYLEQIVTPGYYINPLLIINNKERDFLLSNIVVKFDEEFMTLEQFCLHQGATYLQKYEFITMQVRRYQRDIEERIISRINKIKSNKDNLPKVEILPISSLLFAFAHLALLGFLLGISLTSPNGRDYFYNVNENLANGDIIFFYLTLLLALIGLASFVYTIIARVLKYKDYTKLYNLLIKDDKKVIDVINESKDKLEEHLVKSLEKPQLLNIKVFEFSSCYKLYEDVLALEEKINHKNVDRKFEVKYISKLNLLFAFVFCLLFIVLFFTK